MKKSFIKIAGIINLLTAFIHLIAGQMDLINPLLDSHLTIQVKGELTGVWHMITIILFLTSFLILKVGFGKSTLEDIHQLKLVSLIYILFGIPFIAVSIWLSILAPQWILLMPIGILIKMGLKNHPTKPSNHE